MRLPILFSALSLLSFLFFDEKVASLLLPYQTAFSSFKYVAFSLAPGLHICGFFALSAVVYAFFRSVPLQLMYVTWAHIATGTAVQIIKRGVGRSRPLAMLSAGEMQYIPLSLSGLYHSFPSGHASVCGVLAGCLNCFYPKYRYSVTAVFFILPVIRVLQLKHFPSDVCFGYALGLAMTRGAIFSLDRFRVYRERQKKIEQDHPCSITIRRDSM